MKKMFLVAGLVAALCASSAQAAMQMFNVSFIDPGPVNVAAGVVEVDMLDGIAVSGYLKVLSGVAAGNYNLIPAAAPQIDLGGGNYLSPAGVFYFDNKIVGIPPGPPANPFLTLAGLAFVGTGSQLGNEINLFAEAAGGNAYKFYGWDGSQFVPMASGGAAISPVPEPTTMIAGALLLLPFAVSTIRKMSKKA